MDGDVPRRASDGVYISQLIRFAIVCNDFTDFYARNKCLTAKLLQQCYRYHIFRKTFLKYYRRQYELISKFNVGLKRYDDQEKAQPERNSHSKNRSGKTFRYLYLKKEHIVSRVSSYFPKGGHSATRSLTSVHSFVLLR